MGVISAGMRQLAWGRAAWKKADCRQVRRKEASINIEKSKIDGVGWNMEAREVDEDTMKELREAGDGDW